MAAKKKQIDIRSKNDAVAYAQFMSGLLDSSIKSNSLTDTTVPHGNANVVIKQFDAQNNPLPDVVVSVRVRKLVKLEFDDLS